MKERAMTDAQAGTLTLVFTDIENSSAISEQFRLLFEPTRDAHFRLLRAGLERWRGREVKSVGDSLFLAFDSAANAALWAVEAQRDLAAFDWPTPVGPVRVRIGMHTGEPYLSSDPNRPDYFGPPVNRAARVEAAAHGGQILISASTRVLAQSELPPDLVLRDMGLHRLSGVGEEHLWQVCAPDLSDTFRPLRTLDPERHNLPLPITALVGREQEISAWYALLTGEPLHGGAPLPPSPPTRLLTMTAFGGMGKTRTALHLAELCVPAFPQGVWWVELEGAGDREDLLLRLASSLRLDVSAGRPLWEQIAAFLREREMLLVLDNTEGIAAVAPLVRELLTAAPQLRVLVTTRRALELRGETVVELRPLPEEESRQLFVERARQVRDDFTLNDSNREDVAALCRRLEGVPLALELAAARGIAPREVLKRLTERFKLLQSRSPDLPPRQKALRAAIDWSYDLLSDDDKAVFAQVGVFAGGFTLEDAEAVCEGFDVFESVLELRRHSFFRVETVSGAQEDRYSMLDSLRDYAQERLRELPDGDDVCRRHAEYFLAFARQQTMLFHRAGEADALRALARNEENLRTALSWAAGEGRRPEQAELGLRIGLARGRRGYRAQAVAPVQEGLDALTPIREQHPGLYLELLRERTGLALETESVAEAAKWADEARNWAEAIGDADGIGQAENLQGRAALDGGNYPAARTCFESARTWAQAVGNVVLEAIALNNLAVVERRDSSGDRALAEQYLQAALRIRRKQGAMRGIAETLTNLGVLAYHRQEWDTAREFYAEALALQRQLDNLYSMAHLLFNLSEVAKEQGEGARACRLCAASERILREIGSPDAAQVSAYLAQIAEIACLTVDSCHAEAAAPSLADLTEWALAV